MSYYKKILSICFSLLLLTGVPISATNPPPPAPVLSGEWPIVGQDYGNHGIGTSTINASNAATLLNNQKFFFPTTGFMTAQPSVSNGVAYFGDTAGFMYAVNISTGAQVWKIALGNEFTTTPVVTSDFIYIAGGNLLATFPANTVVKIFCIKRSNGAIQWSKPVSPQSGTVAGVNDYTSDVTVVDNLVIFGIANSENVYAGPTDYKSRGAIVAFDRLTGAEKWRFFTTSDQSSADPRYGGGVGVWSSPGIDVNRKVLFIGSGQNFELPTSPFQDSLIAIDYTNGNLKWFSQMNINDVWSPLTAPSGPDVDISTHSNLFTVNVPGRGNVDFVGVGDKSGRYYILERDQSLLLSALKNYPPIVVTLFLDEAAQDGTIQSTPVIDEVNDIMYVASDALPGLGGFRVSMNAAKLSCDINDLFNYLFCLQPLVVPRIAAYDLKKLVNGVSQQDSLIWEKKNESDPLNRGQTFGPITKTNDILFVTNGSGALRVLRASDGSTVAATLPIGPGSPIFGGVTIVGKQIFVPTLGGLMSYKLP